uniref:Sulfate adenylyltransferase n=1 Tax=Chlorobium chlorochromatii (strain CaD3) TaxID=340177 RepID=SAT_CHLCH|nr:RecName: Full=Sulfate adenylyltransferase; AltName: Full=ATP-sulfurylase; AltName: Full=Sulfate adenylate transferase; Short=SAT [Chlorobium chlorochromatii CaD3]
MSLVNPHGKEKVLKPLLLTGEELTAEKARAQSFAQVRLSSRETGDLIMLGIGGFTPLTGFMGHDDWKGSVQDCRMADGTFWPIPITLSTSKEKADELSIGQEVALVDDESGELMGSMVIEEKYSIDKAFECQEVFKTTDPEHPGVLMVMNQGDVNLAGRVKVFSEGTFPTEFAGIYMTPAETRKMFEANGWSTVAAFQTRNPMHRSHEYLVKIAIEVCDGVLIHQLLGKLKPGDIPADVRKECINALMEKYFVKGTCIQGGYPLDMRYAGPREALLHALFRQNFGCSHLIVGRDHAGVGDYYGPFDAHHIFDQIPADALETKPLKIDWTFYCYKCDGMASMKTCPHTAEDRLNLSGTKLRKMLSEGEQVPEHFSRPEVLEILQRYYASLTQKVDIKLHSHAVGK